MWRSYYVDPADAERLALIAECAALDAQRPRVSDILRIAEHVRGATALVRVSRALEVELQRGRPS
jgi:hypothetical protein